MGGQCGLNKNFPKISGYSVPDVPARNMLFRRLGSQVTNDFVELTI